MHLDSLTDIAASDIMLDVSLYIIPVVLLMDGIHGSSHALVAPHGVVMVNSHDLTLNCFNLGDIGSAFETDQPSEVYFPFQITWHIPQIYSL